MSRPAVVFGLFPAGLALARSLGRAGIDVTGITCDVQDFGLRSRYLSQRFLITDGDEETRDERVLAALRSVARGGRPVLFPERDTHVGFVLRHWEEIRAVADVPLPDDPESIRRLARKDRLPQEAERAGVPAPATVTPMSEEEVRAAPLRPPLLLKPIESEAYAAAFSRKAIVAACGDDAVAPWREARGAGFATVLQEYVPNSHERVFSLFAYLSRSGEVLGAVVGRKVRQAPPRFGSSTVFEVNFDERVYKLGLRLLTSVGYTGFAHVEFAHDSRDDAYKLLEVNPRLPVWAGIAMTPRLDLARLAYDDLCGRVVPAAGVLRETLTWLWATRDVVSSLSLARSGELGFADFVAPYLARPKVRAVLAGDDRRPVLGLLRWAGSRAAAKLAG
jgi:predicted ATP-grasp superfamily ATP-dependent carboligase